MNIRFQGRLHGWMLAAAVLAPVSLSALIITVGSCTGITARREVLMPTLVYAWNAVIQKHVEIAADAPAERLPRGVTAEAIRVAADDMQVVLAEGDRTRISLSAWASILRPAAVLGADLRFEDRKIGPGTRESILETIAQFDLRIAQAVAR